MILNNLAYLLTESDGHLDEGFELAQKAVALAPSDASVADTAGWALYKKGIYPDAVKHLERAVSGDPSARHKYHLAMAYFRAGNRQMGLQVFEAATKLDPSLPEATVALGLLRRSE